MPLQPFTRNFADNSTEAGHQFTFYCDICKDGYKTSFEESKSYKKGKLFKNIGKAAAIGASLAKKHNVGWNLQRGTNIIGERFHGMSPEWHKEHEAAFERAQNEAMGHFQRCPRCHKWVCESDWNEQEGLCIKDAPRMNVEIAAAKSEKMVTDIKEKAQNTQVFSGEIESKQTICYNCQKPASEGKFCTNCGADLSLIQCGKCGANSPMGTRFCGECGTKL